MRLSDKVSVWGQAASLKATLKTYFNCYPGLQELLESERESATDFHEFLHCGGERLRSMHAGHMKAVLGPTTRVAARGPGGASDRAGAQGVTEGCPWRLSDRLRYLGTIEPLSWTWIWQEGIRPPGNPTPDNRVGWPQHTSPRLPVVSFLAFIHAPYSVYQAHTKNCVRRWGCDGDWDSWSPPSGGT